MNLFRIIHPRNWSALSGEKREEGDNLRRDILFSQILVVGIIISTLHLVNDLFNANPAAIGFDVLFVLLLVLFYYLNEKGFHRLAKILDLTLLNALIFALAGVLDERIRMSYNFFPLAILAFIVFYKTELWLSIIFAFIPMALLVILELTSYNPLGDIAIKEGVDTVTMIINIVGSFILLVMGLVFLVKLNEMTEDELKKKELNLRKSNAELDRFVYSASHDLRAPLMSVKGLANLMKLESRDNGLGEYIHMIEKRIADMDNFISEIIDYSRNSRLELDLKPVILEKLIDETFAKIRYLEGTENIELIKDLKVNKVTTDPTRLGVILSNLLSNALKYSDPSKEKRWIRVSSNLQKGHLMVIVEDNGIGIDEHYHKDIFKMFYRASDTSDGSGLGLYIVQETVLKLSGEIEVISSPHKGSAFRLIIPLVH